MNKVEAPGGWNWGAFFLNWIWGISHNTYIALLCFVPFVNLIMIFVLGAKGNEWAWQNRQWESVEQFKKVQKAWAVWGFIIFLISIVLGIIAIASGILAMQFYFN